MSSAIFCPDAGSSVTGGELSVIDSLKQFVVQVRKTGRGARAKTDRGAGANRIRARIYACRKGRKINVPLGAAFESLTIDSLKQSVMQVRITVRGAGANRIRARIYACRKGRKINAPLGAVFESLTIDSLKQIVVQVRIVSGHAFMRAVKAVKSMRL